MFRDVYESTWYQPVFFWIAGAAVLALIARRLGFLYAYLVLFWFEILADGTLTSLWSPVPAGSRLASALSVVFIVLGDARYFVLLARARAGDKARSLGARAWLTAFGLAAIVPAASLVMQRALPSTFANERILYIAYEAMFFVLALAVRAWLARREWSKGADRRWALLATDFEIAQYGLWAIADLVILKGHDAGYALRLVPNTMYYVLFLPFALWSAPRALREPSRERPA